MILQSAASETLEGLRKETRAGLEYALQTHKKPVKQRTVSAANDVPEVARMQRKRCRPKYLASRGFLSDGESSRKVDKDYGNLTGQILSRYDDVLASAVVLVYPESMKTLSRPEQMIGLEFQ